MKMEYLANKKGELLDKKEDYVALGLNPEHMEVWEDGMRMSGPAQPGQYEWWYADAHFDNGYFVVVSFNRQFDAEGNDHPFMMLNITRGKEIICDLVEPVEPLKCTFEKDYCEVHFGNSFICSERNLDTFKIVVDENEHRGYGMELTLKRRTLSYRPGTGYWWDEGKYFAWLSVAPSAECFGTLKHGGESIEVKGSGYHDHNFGNVPMDQILKDWLWGRSEIEGHTVLATSVRFNENSGGSETPVLYVAKGDEIYVNELNDAVVCLDGMKMTHAATGKKMSSDCIYIVENENGKATVRMNGKDRLIASFPPTADAPGKDGMWYARFLSYTSVDIDMYNKKINIAGNSNLEYVSF